jgi:hypothetical protein
LAEPSLVVGPLGGVEFGEKLSGGYAIALIHENRGEATGDAGAEVGRAAGFESPGAEGLGGEGGGVNREGFGGSRGEAKTINEEGKCSHQDEPGPAAEERLHRWRGGEIGEPGRSG